MACSMPADDAWTAFKNESSREAVRFEKYLKSGSGRAFIKRHFAAV
jgi:hypothetical protein